MKSLPEYIVTDPDGVRTCCADVAASAQVGFDTEFVGEDTYVPDLCLVQVATPNALYVLDPFDCGPLDDFWNLLTESGVRILRLASRSLTPAPEYREAEEVFVRTNFFASRRCRVSKQVARQRTSHPALFQADLRKHLLESRLPAVIGSGAAHAGLANTISRALVPEVVARLLDELVAVLEADDLAVGLEEVLQLLKPFHKVEGATHGGLEIA